MRHPLTRALTSGCLLWALSSPVHAHHGRDFLLALTADLPHAKELYVISRQDYIDADERELELEPALFYGATSRIALELHSHVAKEGSESFHYESTALGLHLRLTAPDSVWAIGVFGEYERSHEDEHADNVRGVLMASRLLASARLGLNLIAERERETGANVEWRYAAGYRRPLTAAIDWGIEALGSLEEDVHEALFGLYFEPAGRLTVNIGAGTGLGHEEANLTVRTALVWRLGK